VEVFFAAHDASYRPYKVQYKSAIFFHDPEQERIAREVKASVEERTGRTLYTDVLAASRFYLAEDYHQKYALQGNRQLFGDLSLIYPDIWDMVDSTAATRVNAYLYGYGSAEQLQTELNNLGLSTDGKARLVKVAGKLKPTLCPVPAGS
jgi:hypothetical protein